MSPWQARVASSRSPLHGVLVDGELVADDPDGRVAHVLPLLTEHSVLTGWAAARRHGVTMLDGRSRGGRPLDVAVASPEAGQHRHRAGVRGTRSLVLPHEQTVVRGVRCATLERAVYDELRTCRSLDDAVAVLDMAVSTVVDQPSRTTIDAVRGVLREHAGERGVVLARRAVRHASTRSAGPWESRTRVVAHDAGARHLCVNVPVFDAWGNLLGVAHLVDARTGLVIEVDGAHARELEAHTFDHLREEGFERAGCTVVHATPHDHEERERTVWRIRRALWDAERSRRRAWTLERPPWWESWQPGRRWD